jgi:N-methylhydantoinase A
VNLRAIAFGQAIEIPPVEIQAGDGDPSAAKIRDHEVWMGGALRPAVIYDRAKLRAGDRIPGPAIIVEMDATTLVLADCEAVVDRLGVILINPV